MKNLIFKTGEGKNKLLVCYDQVLTNWPVDHEELTIPTRHGDTFAIVCGGPDLPPLIMLHGAAANALFFKHDIQAYASAFRVYILDIPGEAGKSAPNRLAWNGPGYAEWLEDVLIYLKLEKVNLLGSSQGGWTALRFATLHPRRVNKIALLATGGIVKTKPGFILKAIIYSLLGMKDRINKLVAGTQVIQPEIKQLMGLIAEHFKARIEKEYLFTDAELQQLTMPVYSIGGTEDVVRSVIAINKRLELNIPLLQSAIIPGMGHVVVEQAARIIDFMKG
ncbi:alpha/beta fold hydrolase [Mucilaginibacter sp. 22184]|uniref:alpha/beta fold hydrolase n=1 Tax=Mucilaginibacter sp. 22184 TaxID=3453887 RepID=UPI003F833B66